MSNTKWGLAHPACSPEPRPLGGNGQANDSGRHLLSRSPKLQRWHRHHRGLTERTHEYQTGQEGAQPSSSRRRRCMPQTWRRLGGEPRATRIPNGHVPGSLSVYTFSYSSAFRTDVLEPGPGTALTASTAQRPREAAPGRAAPDRAARPGRRRPLRPFGSTGESTGAEEKGLPQTPAPSPAGLPAPPGGHRQVGGLCSLLLSPDKQACEGTVPEE